MDIIMKKTLLALTLTLVTVSPLQSIAGTQNPLNVAAQELPIPAHASKEIQDLLKVAPAPNVEATRNMKIPTTNEEWKAFVAEFDKAGMAQGIATTKALGVTYEVMTINGVEVYKVTPAEIAEKNENNLFLHIHGGAWLYGGDESSLRESAVIAHQLKIPVISVNYRKAPDHPAPAALNDIVNVWVDLLTERPADSVIIGGTSAGGNLTSASLLRFKDLGLPLPAAAFIGTPAVDVMKKPDSRFVNDGVDGILGTWDGLIAATGKEYIGKSDPKSPYVSPIYGDFTNFPPSILVSGTRDLLLSDTVLLHRAIRDAGSNAELHIYEAHSHGFYLVPGEDHDNFFKELSDFADKNLTRYKKLTSDSSSVDSKVKDILLPES